MWEPIETAPKSEHALIDVWCVPPDGCDFKPTNGGIRLTDVWWHTADNVFPHTGWVRVCDDGYYDMVKGPPCCEFGLPAWKPTHWMPIPQKPEMPKP